MGNIVDAANKVVNLGHGGQVSYDKLVLSPGISLKYDSVPGYSPEVQSRMPHAWTSGTQVQLLRNQVLNMKKGGTFVMVPPPNPYRCPPGPYERVSMVAHLLKERNPTGKIIILDPKPKFSKQGLFMAGWDKHYSDDRGYDPDTHGGIKNINAATMEIETDLDTFKAQMLPALFRPSVLVPLPWLPALMTATGARLIQLTWPPRPIAISMCLVTPR